MKNNPKKYFLTIISIIICLLLLPAIIVAIFDPYYFIHKNFTNKMDFDGSDRYQNSGLINSFLGDKNTKIDTVIIGTSLSQNLPTKILKNKYDVPALKLTLAGGRPKELAIIAEKSISTGNVNKIIWEISQNYADTNTNDLHKDSPLPIFLYNKKISDNWRYIFNNDVLEDALKVAIGKKKKRKKLNDLYRWEHKQQFQEYSSEKNIKLLKDDIENKNIKFIKQDLKENSSYPNIEKKLLPIIKNNPLIQFKLFFPPHSNYSYLKAGNKEYWNQMNMRYSLLKLTSKYKNVKIYSFELINNNSYKISNYMDETHFLPQISNDIATSIMNDTNRITHKNIAIYSTELMKNINQFSNEFFYANRD